MFSECSQCSWLVWDPSSWEQRREIFLFPSCKYFAVDQSQWGDYMSTCTTSPCSFLPFSQEKVILSRDTLPSEEFGTRAVNICKGPMLRCQDLYQCANSTLITVSRLLQHQDLQQRKYTPDSPERKCGIDFSVLCCTLMDPNDRLLLQTAWQKLTKIIYFSLVIKGKAKLRWSQTVSDENFS